MICKNMNDHYVHAKCEGKAEVDAMRKCIKCLQEIVDAKQCKQGTFGGKQGLMHSNCFKKRKIQDSCVY